LALALALLVLGALGGTTAMLLAHGGPSAPLQPWHRLQPGGEITAARPARDLDDYRRREEILFRQVAAQLRGAVSRFPPLSRFDPASSTYPPRFGSEGVRDWNRTFVMTPARPVGVALLLHGLSDSPYSLRALAELLARDGFAVVAPRMPGHGTVPGALAVATREDWRAAVRVAMAATARARPAGGPLVVVGYSNGAALALDYTLQALDDRTLPRPDRLIFLSPALAVTPAARFARLTALAARLPRLAGLGWEGVLPEYDPFKYNSFPTAAAYQVHRLTGEIESSLARLERAGRLAELPPVLTLQSVVDATVPPVPSLTRLYGRVLARESELVLFDANRRATVAALLGPSADELLALATPGRTFPFAVTLVTNESPASDAVVAVSRAAGASSTTREPLGLAWPPGVFSLSHVALPFTRDDPVYGSDGPAAGPLPLGRLELKGERGVLLAPPDLLARLRYDPFFPYVALRVERFVARGRRR
jgi:alpha-beta hydrolase superfamily lysophospholipase